MSSTSKGRGRHTVLLGTYMIAGDAAEAIRQVDACARDMADTAQLRYRGHKVIKPLVCP